MKDIPILTSSAIQSFNVDCNLSDEFGVSDVDNPMQLSIGYDVSEHQENSSLFRVALRLSFELGSQKEVKLKTTIVGYFAFGEDSEKEHHPYIIRVQGCTTLYGMLRGHIAAMTSMMECGQIVLPPVMMQEIVQDIENKKTQV